MSVRVFAVLTVLTTLTLGCQDAASPTPTIPPPAAPAEADVEAPAPRRDPAAELAVWTLLTEDVFARYQPQGRFKTPAGVIAMRILAERPDAANILHKLLSEASPAGKAYALAALQLAKDPGFASAAERLTHDSSKVKVLEGGDVIREIPLSTLVSKIADGALEDGFRERDELSAWLAGS
jgi:hypothetical protein